jgi:hypothetical protein
VGRGHLLQLGCLQVVHHQEYVKKARARQEEVVPAARSEAPSWIAPAIRWP